jgi:NADPH2:quinone reductase
MKAMGFLRYGKADEITELDLPIPEPEPGQIRVKVMASSINPADIRARQPDPARQAQRAFPLITGYDIAGVIDALGPEVHGYKANDKVMGSPSLLEQGGHAEYVVIDYRSVQPIPQGWSYRDAAALPLAGVTALECIERALHIQNAEHVLIHAGAGGVGHLQIQFAKALGLEVWCTAGRTESISLCRQMGADRVIDYREEDFVSECLGLQNGMPVIFDNVGGEILNKSLQALAPMGVIVSIVPTKGAPISESLFMKACTFIHHVMGAASLHGLQPNAQGNALKRVLSLCLNHKLKPYVSNTLPLNQLAKAHKQIESGRTIGKIVITVNESTSSW